MRKLNQLITALEDNDMFLPDFVTVSYNIYHDRVTLYDTLNEREVCESSSVANLVHALRTHGLLWEVYTTHSIIHEIKKVYRIHDNHYLSESKAHAVNDGKDRVSIDFIILAPSEQFMDGQNATIGFSSYADAQEELEDILS